MNTMPLPTNKEQLKVWLSMRKSSQQEPTQEPQEQHETKQIVRPVGFVNKNEVKRIRRRWLQSNYTKSARSGALNALAALGLLPEKAQFILSNGIDELRKGKEGDKKKRKSKND